MLVHIPATEDRADMAAHGRSREAEMAPLDTAGSSRRFGHPEKRPDGTQYVDRLVQAKVWPGRAVVCDVGFS